MTPISKSYRLFSLPRWPEVLKNFPFPSFLTCTLGPLSALPSTSAYTLDLSVISVPTLKPSLFGAPGPHESWNWCPSAQGKEPAWPWPSVHTLLQDLGLRSTEGQRMSSPTDSCLCRLLPSLLTSANNKSPVLWQPQSAHGWEITENYL